MAKKSQNLRLKLKAYDHKLLDATTERMVAAITKTGAKVVGPIPLPTKKEKFTILRAVHKYKDSREQFEIRTHQRMIDIIAPTPQTLEMFRTFQMPNGVGSSLKQID